MNLSEALDKFRRVQTYALSMKKDVGIDIDPEFVEQCSGNGKILARQLVQINVIINELENIGLHWEKYLSMSHIDLTEDLTEHNQ